MVAQNNVSGQSDAPKEFVRAIANLNSGKYGPTDLETIANAQNADAVPVLEREFEKKGEGTDRGKLANVLVRLGHKEGAYWNFLVKQATAAVSTDAPSILNVDKDGKSLDNPSPSFVAWAAERHIPLEQAVEDQAFTYPGAIIDIATTGDPRAIPILRKAMYSTNPLIQTQAATGLAYLNDRDSIELIVAACSRANPRVASGIAESLVYFDDPRAQNAFDHFVPTDQAAEFRKGKASGRGPFGLRTRTQLNGIHRPSN